MVAFTHPFTKAPTAAPSRARRPADAATPRMRLVPDSELAAAVAEREASPDIAGRIDPQSASRADRRSHPRQALSLRVGGRRLDHSVEARREPFLHFAMRDVSVGGLSATSQTPLAVGERVAVFFPPQGAGRGWDAYGRVLRVAPERQGYRVAVTFDPLRAA